MNMFTRVSGKGQVVVPKSVRDRQGWQAGTDLEVVETAHGVLLRPVRTGGRLTMEEAVARLKSLYTHQGPPMSLEEMDRAVLDAVAERYARDR